MANEKPRRGPIGIAGFGSVGRRHFRNLQALGVTDFVFLRSGQSTLDDSEVRSFPVANTARELLAFEPRAVIVATPSAAHLELAISAAEAGCDLYIEKPVGHDIALADQLAEVVRARKLVAMVGCQFRFHPLLAELRRLVHAGRLGQVIGASAEWGEYLPGWHPWEDHRASYAARADLGGGVLLTLIHPFDYLYWFFGPARRVKGIVARVPSLETPAGEDWVDASLEFESGVVGHIHVDYLQRPPTHAVRIVGDRGIAAWDFHDGSLTITSADGGREAVRVPPEFDRNDMFIGAMRHFLACTTDRADPIVTVPDGIAVLRMALEARRTAEG